MQLVERQTGRLVEVPDAKAQAAFQSGQYGIPKGAKLPVFDLNTRTVGEVDAKDAQAALDAHARVATQAEIHEEILKDKYDGASGLGGAALAGAARGFGESFGIPTDAIAIGLAGDVSKQAAADMRERLAQYQQRHPYASMAGEGLGLVGAAALSGGESLLGRAGGLAERLAPEALGRVGAGAARGAGEMAVLGGVEAVNEHALHNGNPDELAENVLAGIGHGAIVGGLAGGAFEGAAVGLGSARDAIGRFASKLRPKEIDAIAEKQFGHAAEGLGEAVVKAANGETPSLYARAAASISGGDVDAIHTLSRPNAAGAEARRIAVFDAPEIQAQMARELRTHGDALLDAMRPVTDHAKGQLKAEYVAKAVRTGNEAATRAAVAEDLQGLISGAEDLLTHPDGVGFAKSVETVSKTAYRALDALKGASDEAFNAKAFVELDNAKRNLQALASRGYKAIGSVGDPIDQLLAKKSVSFFDQAAEGLRQRLEDASLWGRAAEDQQAINAAWTKQIDAAKRFDRALTTDIGRDPRNPYLQVRGVDPAKAETFVKNLVNPNADLTHQATRDFVAGSDELAKAIGKAYDLPPDAAAEVQRIGSAAKAFGHTVQTAEKSLVLANQYKAIVDAEGEGLGMLGGIVGGGMLGGPLGSVLGAVGSAVSRPGKTIRQMAAIERIASQVRKKVDDGVHTFFRGEAKVIRAPNMDLLEGAKGASRREVFADSVREVQKLSADPQLLNERLTQSLGDLATAAPETASALTRVTLVGIKYLSDNVPAGMRRNPEIPWRDPDPHDVSDFEMEEWADRAAVVNDWTKVLDSLNAGHLSSHEVDALRTVHPTNYEKLRMQIRNEMILAQAAKRPELPWAKQVAVSTLLGEPTHPALTPGFIADIQAVHASAPTPPMRQPAGKPVKGIADQFETTTQRIEGRRKP